MMRRACLVGLLLCAAPASARARDSVVEQARAAAAASESRQGVDLGGVLRRVSAAGRDAAPTGQAWITRAEWHRLLGQARRAAGARSAESDARALAVLDRAYALRTGLDEATVAAVRAVVFARLKLDDEATEFGGGARAWLDQGRTRPLAGVAPEVLARVNAEILESLGKGWPSEAALRDRLRLTEIGLGADPRAATADLAALAMEPALDEPALQALLDADLWITGATAR